MKLLEIHRSWLTPYRKSNIIACARPLYVHEQNLNFEFHIRNQQLKIWDYSGTTEYYNGKLLR